MIIEFWKGVGLGLVIACALYGFGLVIIDAIEKQEITECHKWQRYEKEYAGYETSTKTQERCILMGVPVRVY